MSTNRFCDGMKRRDFLKVGALGAGLSLSDYLRLSKAGEVKSTAKAKSVIYIRLGGGPTHMDTFDLKPNAPAEYRGPFQPIQTNVVAIGADKRIIDEGCINILRQILLRRATEPRRRQHEAGCPACRDRGDPARVTFPRIGPRLPMWPCGIRHSATAARPRSSPPRAALAAAAWR